MKKYLLACLILCFLFCPFAPKECTVTANAMTRKEAMTKYRSYLNRKKIKFVTNRQGKNKVMYLPRNKVKFSVAYITKSSRPYIVLDASGAPGIDHSTGYVNVLWAGKKKVKCVMNCDTMSYIKKKGVVGIPVPRSEDMEYHKIKGAKCSKQSVLRPSGKEIFPQGRTATKKNVKRYVK